MIQIATTHNPFDNLKLASQAFTTLGRADAMGLLPLHEEIDTMSLASLRTVLSYIQRAGIGKAIQIAPDTGDAGLANMLERLNAALEESPAPQFEWERLSGILGVDLLSRLLGVAVASIRRYRSAVRTTPDDVAARLHWLTLIAGDLGGAYNEAGIRQWFDRKRAQLGGKSPAEVFGKSWAAGDSGSVAVRDLARALACSPAT